MSLKPLGYEHDAGIRLVFDTLTDRGFDEEIVREALDNYESDLWFEVFGPQIDKIGEAIGIGAYPEDEVKA